MATREEGLCKVDADCSKEQYCYDVSGLCVDHTKCNRYNRYEAEQFSRHPSQCGPCLPGYSSEVLGTGEMRFLCERTKVNEPLLEPIQLSSHLIIWITIAALLVCLMTMVLGIFLKRRSASSRQSTTSNRKQWDNSCEVGPSAPPAETSPFIGCEHRMTPSPFNNNKNLMDKNNLVSATPSKEPNWIRIDPNYELSLSNDHLNASDQSNSVVQLPLADNNSNNWPSEQLAIQMANGALTQYGIEHADNTVNAVLVQRNNPSASNTAENNNNGGGGSSTSGSNNADNRERGHTPNIVISQKISMNVNVLNGDC